MSSTLLDRRPFISYTRDELLALRPRALPPHRSPESDTTCLRTPMHLSSALVTIGPGSSISASYTPSPKSPFTGYRSLPQRPSRSITIPGSRSAAPGLSFPFRPPQPGAVLRRSSSHPHPPVVNSPIPIVQKSPQSEKMGFKSIASRIQEEQEQEPAAALGAEEFSHASEMGATGSPSQSDNGDERNSSTMKLPSSLLPSASPAPPSSTAFPTPPDRPVSPVPPSPSPESATSPTRARSLPLPDLQPARSRADRTGPTSTPMSRTIIAALGFSSAAAVQRAHVRQRRPSEAELDEKIRRARAANNSPAPRTRPPRDTGTAGLEKELGEMTMAEGGGDKKISKKERIRAEQERVDIERAESYRLKEQIASQLVWRQSEDQDATSSFFSTPSQRPVPRLRLSSKVEAPSVLSPSHQFGRGSSSPLPSQPPPSDSRDLPQIFSSEDTLPNLDGSVWSAKPHAASTGALDKDAGWAPSPAASANYEGSGRDDVQPEEAPTVTVSEDAGSGVVEPQVSSAVADAGWSVAVEPQLQPAWIPTPLPPATMDVSSGWGGDELQRLSMAPVYSHPSTDAEDDDNGRWGFIGALGLDTHGSSSPVFRAPTQYQGIAPSWRVATERNASPQKQGETKYSGTVEEPSKSTDEPTHLPAYDRAMADTSSPLSPSSLSFPPPHLASEARRRSIPWSARPGPMMESEHRSTRADDASGMEYNLRLRQESGWSLGAFLPVNRLSTVAAQATAIGGNAPPRRRSDPRLSPLPPTPFQAYSPPPGTTTCMATTTVGLPTPDESPVELKKVPLANTSSMTWEELQHQQRHMQGDVVDSSSSE